MLRRRAIAAAGTACALCLAGPLPRPAWAGDAPVVKATLEPAVIGKSETTLLTIEVRSTNLSSVHFRPDFNLENLEVLTGPSQWDNVQIVNGTFSRSFRMSWRLRPLATGKAAVRSLRLQLDNELIQMRDREVTVQDEPTGQSDGAPAEEPQDPIDRFFGPLFQREPAPTRQPGVFLRSEVQPPHPFAGQQALYTVYLYSRDDISSLASREMPTFRGFWVRDVPQPQHLPLEMVSVGGQRFARVVVIQKALFPLRPGSYTIEPSSLDVLVRMVESRWFGPPLSHPEQMTLQAPALTVDVQPLPPAPPGFAGAVGQLALTARLEPQHLRLGEAATLTVTLAGKGNVQGVAVPGIAPPAGLEILPPQQQGDERVVGTAVQGTRTWSWAVVPKRTGAATLRVPETPYFDPQSGRYQTASVPPLTLTTLAPAADTTAAGMLQSLQRSGVRPAPGAGTLSWRRLLPWLFAVPCGIALVFTLARRRRHALHPLPAHAPAAFSAAERSLREAAAETRPRQAAARMEETWRELLLRRWGVPSCTPAACWGQALQDRGGDPGAADELCRLAEDLQYLRNAPQLSATEALGAEALARSHRLLRRLR
ncbi:MAG TPA: BatD family protein [Thermoanaerobaculia bacterium]|jgi:hypothetical protein|nr:BatD family protein [Thermoanaerobaculia bacterium]